MMHRKPNDRFDLRELSYIPREPLERCSNPMEDVSEITTSSLLDIGESRCSSRIVRTPNRFLFLGGPISDELDLDPNSYNETISDKDFEN